MRGMNTKLAVAGVAISSIAGAAFAEEVTYQLNPVTLNFNLLNSSDSSSFLPPVPKFDPALGTLSKVKLDLKDATMTSSGTAKTTGLAGQFVYNADVSLWILDSGSEFPVGGSVPSVTNPHMTLSATTGLVEMPANTTYEFTLNDGPDSAAFSYTNQSVLNTFIASTPGDLINYVINGEYVNSGSWTNVSFNPHPAPEVTLSGSVTYYYSSVPEATTLLLGMVGGAPLLMHRGRRVRKTA